METGSGATIMPARGGRRRSPIAPRTGSRNVQGRRRRRRRRQKKKKKRRRKQAGSSNPEERTGSHQGGTQTPWEHCGRRAAL